MTSLLFWKKLARQCRPASTAGNWKVGLETNQRFFDLTALRQLKVTKTPLIWQASV